MSCKICDMQMFIGKCPHNSEPMQMNKIEQLKQSAERHRIEFVAKQLNKHVSQLIKNEHLIYFPTYNSGFEKGIDVAQQFYQPIVDGLAESLETYMKWASNEGTLDSERAKKAREALENYRKMMEQCL